MLWHLRSSLLLNLLDESSNFYKRTTTEVLQDTVEQLCCDFDFFHVFSLSLHLVPGGYDGIHYFDVTSASTEIACQGIFNFLV